MARPKKDDGSLTRLGGGRWRTRDDRFTIEPQSGTWVVVDAEQTDDLGLALVRGPFGGLTGAKEAIDAAREVGPPVSPQAARLAQLKARPAATPAAAPHPRTTKVDPLKRTPRKPKPPVEPRWIQGLEPEDRRRARRLIARLASAGAPDPEEIARRDIVGNVPAAATFAVVQAIQALGPTPPSDELVRRLADGRDANLGVRWRLVDGDGRPIGVELSARDRDPR